MLKLKNQSEDSIICIDDMKDGDIGVIVKWTYSQYCGSIIQRYKNTLITLGADSGHSWTTIFKSPNPCCHVRLLKPGELLVVEEK